MTGSSKDPHSGTGPPQAPPLRLAVFGFDSAEAAQRRRIRSYLDCGFDVIGFTMRRANMKAGPPFWDNIHLYDTENENMTRRLRAIAGSVGKVRAHRDRLQGTDVIVARNLDMLAIAAAARAMLRPRPPLIYECLDIHGMMTDPGPKGRVARALERRLLARTAALIVSSPAFVREYFAPVQGWNGPTALIENKVWIEGDGPARPDPGMVAARPPDAPLRLGWVGTLRCAKSLAILAEAARRLGPRLEVTMHGVVHRHAMPEFDATLSSHPNLRYHGPYAYPEGLAPVYAQCDLVWSQDLWQWGTNSTWLLPNRIYEASYFGCPSVAVAGSETGRRVADGLGWTIPEPAADALVALLETLDADGVAERRRALLEMPEGAFRQSAQEIRDAIRLPLSM